ncbi:MutS-related protein [Desertivirga xinjiangensis]|uniref:MutS-related protein n=1 Tax=Desertivirga xinjiangensis TaxID=539206 RepID=UPI002109757D|nr:DNA mismatch repair protein MutS [Pedobacter xinjiangensis]
MSEDILAYYREGRQLAAASLKKYDRLINTYSFLRLFVLLSGGFALYKSLEFEMIWLTECAFFFIIVLFAWLVSKQAKFEERKRFYTALLSVHENEINSIQDQENMYQDGTSYADDGHIYTSDLDIFGKRSLFALLNRAASIQGCDRLAGWLREKAETEDVLARQEALKELSQKRKWLQDFKALMLFAKDNAENEVRNLYKYLEVPLSLHSLIKLYVRYQPFVFFPAAVMSFYVPSVAILVVVMAMLNFGLVSAQMRKVNTADRLLGKAGRVLYHYSQPFKLLENEAFNSKLCKQLNSVIEDEKGGSFSHKIKQLSKLLNRLEYRLNVFVGPLLNFCLAWDLRQLIAIEQWKQANKIQIAEAFNSLAEYEALVSLCSLHTNYPDWCFPEIVEGKAYTFKAKKLGHPLIPAKSRVENDFVLEDAFKVDIITGSNMAGKSTFLRTIGINMILALAGAPVCAARLTLSNMHVFTYMRIKDSLNENTSTFKAELNRLKLLLETLRADSKIYFLIDEMLRGTNSVDKYRGSKAVIEKLIGQQAVGIVATHDLQIARLEDKYPQYVRNYYFDIQLNGVDMHFDYKLKNGECTTFNASQLLRQLGIEVEEG